MLPVAGGDNSLYTKTEDFYLVAQSGYLLRSVNATETSLDITGDLNTTSPLWIVGGAPKGLQTLTFNGEEVEFSVDERGAIVSNLTYVAPQFDIPVLEDLQWFYIDSLPEIQDGYDDDAWTAASLPTTNNPSRNLTTPTSLYASDYGFHAGSLIFRGKFTAKGNETTFKVETQGGTAYGASVFLDDGFLGSTLGNKSAASANATFALPQLDAGGTHTFTILIDHMGVDEEWTVGSNTMRAPRGILNYDLAGRDQSDITWKLTGNLGGEDYIDHVRGPLNEGALWAERQGYHQPGPPVDSWSTDVSPTNGIGSAGVGFFATSFDLDLPAGYDVPLSVRFPAINSTSTVRVQLWVNGWQYGKYVSNIGPQTEYPVPEGIWNYQGQNWLAVSLWALEATGGSIESIELIAGETVQTGRDQVEVVDSPAWSERAGAY